MDKALHFLREFPAWIVLLGLFVFLMIAFIQAGGDVVTVAERHADAVLASLFTALAVGRRGNSPSITADTINTGDVAATPETPKGENENV
jgi:hypothetical protein